MANVKTDKQMLNELSQSIERDRFKLSKKEKRLRLLRSKIELVISDHAKLRYIERVLGIDVEAICAPIFTPQLIRLHQTLGDGTFPVDDTDLVAIVKNNVVITIIKQNG